MVGLGHLELTVLVVAASALGGVVAAVAGRTLSLPTPAILLLAASGVAWALPRPALATTSVQQIAVLGLVLVLYEGGLQLGAARLRHSLATVLSLGIAGTCATGVLVALAAHLLLGLAWAPAGVLGTALAPTDPAVVFSVLGAREIEGDAGVVLQGESGANDPVGIAVLLGVLAGALGHPAAPIGIAAAVLEQLAIGVAIGVAGGLLLGQVLRGVPFPAPALYPVVSLLGSFVIFAAGGVAGGSGFIAVFVAGLLVSEAGSRHQVGIERFHGALASLAELSVFIALGLSVPLDSLAPVWLPAVGLALVIAFVARPVAVAPLLVLSRLRRAERWFVLWAGLKGAVPILLASFALNAGLHGGTRIYHVVFVVVGASVLVQGTSIPKVAEYLGVPMRPRVLGPLVQADE